MSGLYLLDEIVKQLEYEQDVVRIKKLVYCACQDSWENDVRVLNNYHFQDLIPKLIKLYPNINQLSNQLYSITNNLSRPVVYSVVAGKLINYLAQLYQEPNLGKQLFNNDYTTNNFDKTLELVVAELEQDPEFYRIKKIIICAYTSKWPSASQIAHEVSLKESIQATLQIYPTIEKFSQAICSIVSSLSKPVIYAGVAQTIICQVDRLYNQPVNYTDTVVELAETLELLDRFALPLEAQELEPDNNTSITKSYSDSPVTELKSRKNDSSEQTELVVKPKSSSSKNLPNINKLKVSYNPFDLRLSIIKSTNPLRAKILIFSTLYRPFKGGQDWLAIKDYELDDLLLSLFYKYQNFPELESQLYRTIDLLHEPDEYHQVAGAIMQSMQTCAQVI